MNGGTLVLVVGGGIAAALGISWYLSKSQPGKTKCEAACIAAAKMAGVTGNLDELCKGSCQILDGLPLDDAGGVVSTGIKGVYGALTGDTGPKCREGYVVANEHRELGDGFMDTVHEILGHSCVPADSVSKPPPPAVPQPHPVGGSGSGGSVWSPTFEKTPTGRGPRGGVSVT